MTFDKNIKGYFIGIGGVGVNALAKFALDYGVKVSGSDGKINGLCNEIASKGAQIFLSDGKLSKEQMAKIVNADFVCFSSAIPYDNKELAYARKLGKRVLERHELLAEISHLFGKVIAIAGTHGKTSTTSMAVHILKNRDVKFVGFIGGESVDFSNYVNNSGGGDIGKLKDCTFVCEACEYKRHLLSLNPDVALVGNAELDHPDSYKCMDEINETFSKFLSDASVKILSNEYAYLVDMQNCEHLKKYKWFRVQTIGEQEKSEIKCLCKKSHALVCDEKSVRMLKLKDGGQYNYHNATFALAAAKCAGVSLEDGVSALDSYKGVKRRFEYAGTIDCAKVYFDFAHHPREIENAIKRASHIGKTLVVFQPHTYSRTKAYLDDFADALCNKHSGAKCVVLMPTYAAREQKSDGVGSDELASAIFDKFCKNNVYLMKNAQSTVDFVKTHAKSYRVVLMLGAGDIYDLKEKLWDK